MNKIFKILIIFPLSILSLKSQLPPEIKIKIDSLQNIIETSDNDTIVVNALVKWDNIIYASNPELDYQLNKKIDSICQLNLNKKLNKRSESFFFKNRAFALNNLGLIYNYRGEYFDALKAFNESLSISKKTENSIGQANSLLNLAMVYDNQGDFVNAVDYLSQSLKIYEKEKNDNGIAKAYNNMGVMYKEQKEYDKALELYQKSLNIKLKIDDKENAASSYVNIGNIYFEQKKYDKAMASYDKGLKLFTEIGFEKKMGSVLMNIANTYSIQNDYKNALLYHHKSLAIRKKIHDLSGETTSLKNIASLYRNKGEYQKSLNILLEAHQLAEKIGSIFKLKEVSKEMWLTYKSLKNYKKSLEMYETFISLRDSINSTENQKAILRQQYKYEYEKQAVLDSVAHAKEQKLADATIAQQKAEAEKKDAELEAKRNQQYALFGGVGLLLIFGGFMYNRFRITRKQKSIIEKQKQEVDHQKIEAEKQRDFAQKEHQEAERQRELVQEKNTEILDSINYAKRLQDAILPSLEVVKQHFPQSFILFKPKDIVSGDFYWMETTKTHTFLAAADCTGHGVPGAMVSVVCASALNKAVNELGKTEPAEILNATRELVIATFAKAGSDVKDGMDIALIAFNKPSEGSEPSEGLLKVSYAGANNPLWVIRNCATEVEEIKADKQPIGLYGNLKPFTSHEVEIHEGDSLYMFSDGYADQFGGPDNNSGGKKFKSKNFKKLLLSIQDLPINNQEKLIDDAFENWKGNMEQLDDVCVIGVQF